MDDDPVLLKARIDTLEQTIEWIAEAIEDCMRGKIGGTGALLQVKGCLEELATEND